MTSFAQHTDQELMQGIRGNDAAAFTALFNRHYRNLYLTALNILRRDDVSRDLVQDVFTQLWVRRHELEIAYPNAWLQQSIRFQVFKAIRDQKIDERFYDRLMETSSELLDEQPLLFKELDGLVREILASLPGDARRIFLLSREEKLSYREIACKMDISVKTVEKKMTATLKVLRTRLRDAMFTIIP
ncbi:RNA polymerase sigma-70 factor [Chitinophaga pollutisoli]|uniref:RNA polymerase sigma-70 factor n=1 Tax=Chitinophaga pollutisoli TaxID=3133966 RepID=A0ABZ2YVM3_9BACT